jgi:hypothetical protein
LTPFSLCERINQKGENRCKQKKQILIITL